MFHVCSFNNKYAFAISYLPLIVYNNITIIKYNSIKERRNGTKGDSGLQHNKIIHIAIYSVIIIHDNNYTVTDASETQRLRCSLTKVARSRSDKHLVGNSVFALLHLTQYYNNIFVYALCVQQHAFESIAELASNAPILLEDRVAC